MLSEYRGIGNVHRQTQAPGDADANQSRLLDAPIQQHQRHQVGLERERHAGQRQQITDQPEQQRQHHEPWLDRKQDLFGSR